LLLADDRLQGVTRLGNVREINLGFDLVSFGAARSLRPAAGRRLAGRAETGSYLFRFVLFKRTGMTLFLGDSHFWKHVENRLTLNFQLSRQIVDSNLAHPPFPSYGLFR
jgi:hypothetical protein